MADKKRYRFKFILSRHFIAVASVNLHRLYDVSGKADVIDITKIKCPTNSFRVVQIERNTITE